MAHLTKVNISSPSTVNAKNENSFRARVTATIEFSDLERSIGLSYRVRIGLYEIDGKMDVYSVFPNNQGIFVQHADRGSSDDFLGFSPAETIKADAPEKTLSHEFDVPVSVEPDLKMELKALVVCVPETATAMKWSSTESVVLANG